MNALQKKVLTFGLADITATVTTSKKWARAQGIYLQPIVWEDDDGGFYKTDRSLYRQPLDCCYFCGKRYKDYATEYEGYDGQAVTVFAAKSGVCKTCAEKQAAAIRYVHYPYIVKKYERRENGDFIQVHEYSDGVITEGKCTSISAAFDKQNSY